jgi:hypothetical protein
MRLFPLIGAFNEAGRTEYSPQQGTRPFVLLLTVSGHEADMLRDARKRREALRGKQAGGLSGASHNQAALLLRLCDDGYWTGTGRFRCCLNSFGEYRHHEGKKKAQTGSNAVPHRENPSPPRFAASTGGMVLR